MCFKVVGRAAEAWSGPSKDGILRKIERAGRAVNGVARFTLL